MHEADQIHLFSSRMLKLPMVLASLFLPAATIGVSLIAEDERPEKGEERRRKA